MKKVVLCFLLALPFTGFCQQHKYLIKARFDHISPKAKAYLIYQVDNMMVIDSCRVKGGTFTFSGVIKEPLQCTLVLGHGGKLNEAGDVDSQSVYLEAGSIQVEGENALAKAKVWGTPLNLDNQEKQKLIKSIKGLGTVEEPILMSGFVRRHPASRVSLDWMVEIGGRDNLVIESYPELSEALKQTKAGKELGHAIKTSLSIRAGKPAPDFALPDQNGRLIRLSDFRGKYVLLDFWASWCKPCRALQPKLKALYDALNATGKFVILAISLDKDKAAWLKAIQEDKVPWLQVADLGKAQNQAAVLYDVNLIPASFLIGPDGVILNSEHKAALMRDKILPSNVKNDDAGDIVPLSDLNYSYTLKALEKENLSAAGFKEEFEKLNSILETDIGERALANDIGKLDIEKDSIALREMLSTRGVSLHKQKLKMKQAFIAAHPDSFMSLFQLNQLDCMYSADSYAVAYEALSGRLKNTTLGSAIRERIVRMKVTPTGTEAIDFIRKDQYGKTVKLSDYRGKLVLLDFWGSWCVPCRQTHPHLKELYAKYKSKGLEIVAVANEKNRDPEKAKQAWLAAIKKDDINWVHVRNDEGTGEPDIVRAYGINGYPTKLLLDQNGKILMRVSTGLSDEMDVLIKQLLDK
ncbi:TlpA disulfide reductase family protein [Pedobacter nyackensis]|uniref:TlpA disulfide reductase family protein n=1 Tax=Pedobacter nyackensis TaxID=475255 RepID=UPI00292EC550|nr:TlpA disulfide reductase family protein [Pedobacter nyackensis]